MEDFLDTIEGKKVINIQSDDHEEEEVKLQPAAVQ